MEAWMERIVLVWRSITRGRALAPALMPTLWAALMLSPGPARAQTPPPDAPRAVRLEDLPQPIRLGARSRSVQQKLAVLPITVIVRDRASYVEAIGAWSIDARWPVLIDDGSALSAEHIARFNRAFKPLKTVRFRAAHPDDAWDAEPGAVEAAAARAWGVIPNPTDAAATARALRARWAELEFAPPGVVVANAGDPAWTAALALAAGRGQPIIWIAAPKPSLHAPMSESVFDGLDQTIRAALDGLGYPYQQAGDVIDAVTLCTAIGQTITHGTEALALTDRLGRSGWEAGPRWAYCGQIFGGPAAATYQAMSALFLDPRSAWLFDGYPDEPGWRDYDLTAAADIFRKINFTATVLDTPEQSLAAWQRATEKGVDAGVIFVNTKGNADFFDLAPGTARSGDVPFLNQPAVVHFVHSYSAAAPAARTTIGGRWLERGAFAYYGSTSEPTLAAFVASKTVAVRMASGAAWGAAPRYDDGQAWKLTVIGDPLFTLGPPAPRLEAAVRDGAALHKLMPLSGALDGAADLAMEAGATARAGDFAGAVRALVMLGRDGAAAELAAAVARERAKDFTPELARQSILAMWRAGKTTDLIAACQVLSAAPGGMDQDGAQRDALWTAMGPALSGRGTPPTQATLDLLKENLRRDQIRADLGMLAVAWGRVNGVGAAQQMARRVRDTVSDPNLIRQIDAALEDLKKRPR